jgi:multiple sugar transport system permease protein
LLLNEKVSGLSVWRTLYFVPSIVPAIASAYLWTWMFNTDFGVINSVLKTFGLPGPKWFGSEEWVLPAFIIMQLWGAGGGLVLYLAALQGVPTTLYEAAKVDGAKGWQQLVHVTLPMTSPVILFTFLTGIIGSFQVFTAGYVVTNGGPNNASLFYVLYLFRNGWRYYEMGYAAALAWVLLLIILVLTVLSLYVSRRLVYYEVG